ncbi:MAG: ethanolamine ammonia-lyase reactivating factor EutA [Hyphomicrobiales bacterium]|nr:ethanolamine ammonia-lyase reactivating factor EutA [Hyphomicrobiales bacterium]
MHDLEFEHLHVSADDAAAVNEVAWAADNVELTTVGIDIGSSTSHLMFARVHLQRLSTALSSRFVVIDRRVLWQSPILLTPYRSDYTIDVDELSGFIGGCYAYAGIAREKVDSGAVILTGEALKRRNARAIADLFSEEAGKFVCASAGHHMECQMAAHGSGAVALSRSHNNTILNIDIGGGTTKFSLVEKGRILATCAIAVGGRLIVEEDGKGLTRVEPPAEEIAHALGIELSLGRTLAAGERRRIAARMARLVMGLIDVRQPGELSQRLMVTEAWPPALANKGIDALTFSGGVAEYLYKREERRFGDLGSDLAEELRHALAHRRDLPPVWDPGQGIRATVIGAAQFSVQISGNTILIADPAKLPLQNLPVLACDLDLGDEVDAASITEAVHAALARADFVEGESPVALSFPWRGDPSHARLHAVASGICAALPHTLSEELPLVLLIDGDVGKSLGRIIRHEVAPAADVIAIDGVQLKEFDYVDIGNVIEVTNVVPIIIKSLLFK